MLLPTYKCIVGVAGIFCTILFLPEYGVCLTGEPQHLQFIDVVFLYTPSIEINLSQCVHLLLPMYIEINI